MSIDELARAYKKSSSTIIDYIIDSHIRRRSEELTGSTMMNWDEVKKIARHFHSSGHTPFRFLGVIWYVFKRIRCFNDLAYRWVRRTSLKWYEPSDKTRLKFKAFLNNTIQDIMTTTNYDVGKHTITRPESFKRQK